MENIALVIIFCILFAGGAIAGTFAGFLGVGGAFMLIPFQFYILTKMGYAPDIAMKTAIATTLCFTLPTAANSAYNHSKKGTVLWKKAALIGTAGFVCSFIGAYIASFLSAAYLCVIFGLIVLAASLKVSTVKKLNEDESKIPKNITGYLVCGTIMGLASGLVGIGGGLVLIPLMILIMKFPMRNAVGTSAAAMIFTSAGGICGYVINGTGIDNPIPYTIGYINPFFWVALIIPGIIFSRFGASFSYKTEPRKIRNTFSIISFLIGSFMIIKGISLLLF